jgi:predicted acetyltransferase
MHMAPHRGELVLTTVEDEGLEEFVETFILGFHSEFNAEEFAAERETFEPDRCFGFKAGNRWVATALAHGRTMSVPGGSVGAAAVTAVTVAPGYRRRGLLTQMMKHQLHDVIDRGIEPLALLWASESLIYGRFGYGQTTRMYKLSGPTREMDFLKEVDLGAGSTDEVSKDEFLEFAPPLRSRIFADRPGHLERDALWWKVNLEDPERWRRGAGPIRYALHFAEDGTPDGFATFRVKRESSLTDQGSEVVIHDLDGTTPTAYAALWRWLLDLDLVRAKLILIW